MHYNFSMPSTICRAIWIFQNNRDQNRTEYCGCFFSWKTKRDSEMSHKIKAICIIQSWTVYLIDCIPSTASAALLANFYWNVYWCKWIINIIQMLFEKKTHKHTHTCLNSNKIISIHKWVCVCLFNNSEKSIYDITVSGLLVFPVPVIMTQHVYMCFWRRCTRCL